MANISIALVKITLLDQSGNDLGFNFTKLQEESQKTYDLIMDALNDISYDVFISSTIDDTKVELGGRWAFRFNLLEWKEEMNNFVNALVVAYPMTDEIILKVFDCDDGNDWAITYTAYLKPQGVGYQIAILDENEMSIDDIIEKHKGHYGELNMEDEDDRSEIMWKAIGIEQDSYFGLIV